MKLGWIAVVLACLALAGCGTRDPAGSEPSSAVDESATIEVPDVTGDDGADAVSTVETDGLTATLADANQDTGFDDTRDASGCEVTDQDPPAGEMAAEGDEVTITVDCAQADWEDQEGPAWESFSEAYSSGFDDGCQQLFDASPNGSFYEDDDEYTATDCQSLNPGDGAEATDIPTDVPDDPDAAGAEIGELDGCQALFEQEGVASLNYGTDSITEDACPVGPPAVSATPKQAAPDSKQTLARPCRGTSPDGKPLLIRADTGKVKCSGALALANEWLRRAPSEGSGSGGGLTVGDWYCIGATATQAPRVGTCERTDHTSAFSMSNGK